TYIAELSFGMKKKLMLIPLFIPQIDLLVLDEIFIGIDTDTQNKIINQLVEHYKKGSTIILVEHNEFLVDSIKEKVSVEELICRDGQIKFI
ncbi:ABC transporter ATP-binding protein, partial [Aerococcaceae bacterium NML180378]|nr:ABC transporter ATP-binding protein [Aerococcaceae bacterium NML180378]